MTLAAPMQAVVYRGTDVGVRDVPTPSPVERELLVRVRGTALNRADLMQRDGVYPGPDATPDGHRVPGLEYAGQVEDVGPAVSRYRPGDRVFGLVPAGGHAQFVVTDERLAMPVPDALTWAEAASIPEAYLTAYDALFIRGDLQPGQTALVHAAGSGVGTACTLLARAAGARVIATVGSDAKIRRLQGMGAVTVDRRSHPFEDVVLATTGGVGADLVIDFVGGSYLKANTAAVRKGGTIVVLGVLGGDTGELSVRDVLLKWVTIVGSTLRGRSFEEREGLCTAFATEWLPSFTGGPLYPVVDSVFPLVEVSEAHRVMRSNQNIGKIVLIP